jgi:N,N-dimethylformamidase
MLIGHVSDEYYLAMPGVHLEFQQSNQEPVIARSTASGAVYANIGPGEYRVILAKEGYGSKQSVITIAPGRLHQFRLLSDSLLGYVWPKWARAGDRAEFRVHSVEQFRLSLWRYGRKKEFVRLLGWHDEHGPRAMMQITPDGDYTQSGVGWNKDGYSNPHINHMVEAPERSGLFYFHAETLSGKFFSFPWVVAPKSPSAPIAVLASTNNWNAYNNFGGRSNYVNSTGLPPTPIVNARLDLLRYKVGPFAEWRPSDDKFLPISFERPEPGCSAARDEAAEDPIKGRLQSTLAPGEWRLLSWLEREDFAYDLYSDYQLHAGQLDLSAYKLLICGVHPEYWSREMYTLVKEWVNKRGGRFIYLGGNGINAEVEFPDATTMRVRSHLLTEGSLGMTDPNNPGTVYESRFHRTVESEANLLGVVSTADAIMSAAPYQVIKGDHWVFSGTGLRTGDTFGRASLHERCPGGASGYETDKISRFSPKETVLLAKGLNPDNGGAEMICYELNSGGKVFSAGSITWVASILVDKGVSDITANVIRRFLT